MYIIKTEFCNSTSYRQNCPDPSQTFCQCTHLIEVGLNDLIELVVYDGGHDFEAHTLHLHGHYFSILGIEKVSNFLIF